MAERLCLHDIDDTVAFCGAIVGRSGIELSHYEREDLFAHLVGEAWIISTKYDESVGVAFSAWATLTLKRRVVDWQRQRFGRTTWKFKDRVYERPRPVFVSLDYERDQLDESLGSGVGDPADGGDIGLSGLLATGDRTRARDLRTLGLKAPR